MIETQESREKPPAFEFTGGRLCLDYVNTVDDRLGQWYDQLQSYGDLLLWGKLAGVLGDGDIQALREEAARHPGEAERALRRAVDVREAMYRIFLANIEGGVADAADLTLFNASLARALSHASIVSSGQGFAWGWDVSSGQLLERVVWPAIRSAADVLTSPDLKLVRVCASEDCGWLFIDESKNHSRRWCDMKTCGNRAKARKHYRQKKMSA